MHIILIDITYLQVRQIVYIEPGIGISYYRIASIISIFMYFCDALHHYKFFNNSPLEDHKNVVLDHVL